MKKEIRMTKLLSILNTKIKNYEKYQTVGKYISIQKDLHYAIYHAVLAVSYWTKYDFKDRVMVNDTRVSFALLNDCKKKYYRFFVVGMFFNTPDKGF